MSDSTEIALTAIKEDGYRLGDFQALRYDPKSGQFPEDFLAQLYFLSKDCRRRSGDGVLSALFGGNPESTFDAIVTYLASHPLIVMGRWTENGFIPMGYAFVAIFCGTPATELAAFCGYTIFRESWGKEEGRILSILGLTALFQEFNLVAIHGIRYEENLLTKRFTERFGFREVGRIPHYQLKDGKLVPGVVSTLLRADFETYLEKFLIEVHEAQEADRQAEFPF
ncbi:MAG: GNAT family N-acetyltransferase [Acidobacteria bacterium]|nr:GNAT family N-acetyltransferase [Acidobacteriota bacterium]